MKFKIGDIVKHAISSPTWHNPGKIVKILTKEEKLEYGYTTATGHDGTETVYAVEFLKGNYPSATGVESCWELVTRKPKQTPEERRDNLELWDLLAGE